MNYRIPTWKRIAFVIVFASAWYACISCKSQECGRRYHVWDRTIVMKWRADGVDYQTRPCKTDGCPGRDTFPNYALRHRQ